MHTQTESDSPRGPAGPATLFPAAAGLGLYLLTLLVEVLLGASLRWLLNFICAAVLATFVPLELTAGLLTGLAALIGEPVLLAPAGLEVGR